MERFTQKLINGIIIGLIVIGIAAAIWEAIPAIIKVFAVVGIIAGFFGALKSK